ncbi:globin family protein [Labrenzia sp. PHM005]|uniref:globin family protein n=1 Tax=Labrenzia sp. PHM005 TaxID=2590016 RepID=UPI0011407CE7|nr:globin family protein [Labrenzia sp. PHM005]QDG79232.1 hemin receptor [Labrenzia sp. PHM005]
MNKHEIKLVQDSFAKAAPLGEKVAEIFYQELFEIDPALKSMFKNDMKDQGKKLLSALTMIVRNLENTDVIVPAAEKLAVKHLDYGVTARHYTFVGNALLRTLKKGLGNEFTPEVREAWITAYQLLADVMRAAAYPQQRSAARG